MALDELIFNRLQSGVSLKSLVGDRCYPERAAQGASLPYVVWSYPSENSMNGLEAETGTDDVRVQFDVYGAGRNQARTVLTALRAVLKDWVSIGTTPAISGCTRQGAVNDFEADPAGSEIQCYRIIQDYLMWVE